MATKTSPIYFLPSLFTTLNNYIALERGHRMQASAVKNQETTLVMAIAREQGWEPLDMVWPVKANFMWIRPDALTDMDNIAFSAKFVLDGLVRSGILPDDDHSVVVGMEHWYVVDGREPGLLVWFESVSQSPKAYPILKAKSI